MECQLPEIHLQTSFIVAGKRKAIWFVWQLNGYECRKTHSMRNAKKDYKFVVIVFACVASGAIIYVFILSKL